MQRRAVSSADRDEKSRQKKKQKVSPNVSSAHRNSLADRSRIECRTNMPVRTARGARRNSLKINPTSETARAAGYARRRMQAKAANETMHASTSTSYGQYSGKRTTKSEHARRSMTTSALAGDGSTISATLYAPVRSTMHAANATTGKTETGGAPVTRPRTCTKSGTANR